MENNMENLELNQKLDGDLEVTNIDPESETDDISEKTSGVTLDFSSPQMALAVAGLVLAGAGIATVAGKGIKKVIGFAKEKWKNHKEKKAEKQNATECVGEVVHLDENGNEM